MSGSTDRLPRGLPRLGPGRLWRALAAVLFAAVGAQAADKIVVGDGAASPGEDAWVPLYVTDQPGTGLDVDLEPARRIQAIALEVLITNVGQASGISAGTDGVLTGLTPAFESLSGSGNRRAWIVSYNPSTNPIPFDPGAPSPGNLIGWLQVTISPDAEPGSTLGLFADPGTTALGNFLGTFVETVANGHLELEPGWILVEGPLFSDGFESGDTSAWSSTVGGG